MKTDVEFYVLPNGVEPAKEFFDSLDLKMREQSVVLFLCREESDSYEWLY